MSSFFGEEKTEKDVAGGVSVSMMKSEVVLGNLVQFKIENDAASVLSFQSPCEAGGAGNLEVFRLVNGQKLAVSQLETCQEGEVPSFEVQPGESGMLELKAHNIEIFAESGKYQAIFKFAQDGAVLEVESEKVIMEEPGMFRKLFRAIITKPLFNLMVFLGETIPGNSLGVAIILMTLLVRVLLFAPNQKAMKSQRKLQKLQPKMEEIKKKHSGNQQMMALKTMELYKTHKINPMSSCLPMLAQMPFLIGIYFVVQDGLSPHLKYLLYSFNQGVDLSIINTTFLGINLEVPEVMILPFLVGGAQYLAIKLSMISAKKKEDKDKKPEEGMAAQMVQMQKMMLYVLPVMIGVFTMTFPAGVGIYWLTSTLFGIGQQKLVNHQLDKVQVKRKLN